MHPPDTQQQISNIFISDFHTFKSSIAVIIEITEVPNW